MKRFPRLQSVLVPTSVLAAGLIGMPASAAPGFSGADNGAGRSVRSPEKQATILKEPDNLKAAMTASHQITAVPDSGTLVVTSLVSAPFPHGSRAQGHRYKDKLYPADRHYSDGTVALFVPKGFRETGTIDLVVHFHGWYNHIETVLRQFRLIEQFAASRRNAVLVVPQGPRDAPDSSGGRLEETGAFRIFIEEALAALHGRGLLTNRQAAAGRVVLSGHSGGYRVISAILDHGGMDEHLAEVWLFDGLYAETARFLAWAGRNPAGRFINIYTDDGGTLNETQSMINTLTESAPTFRAMEYSAATPSDLRTNHLLFLHTELGHNDVVATRNTFREFLETSCLKER